MNNIKKARRRRAFLMLNFVDFSDVYNMVLGNLQEKMIFAEAKLFYWNWIYEI